MVGDKPHERKAMVEILQELGHQIEEAENGMAGWNSYLAHHYDAIISDYLMPEMDGMELCRRVRHGSRRISVRLMSCSTR